MMSFDKYTAWRQPDWRPRPRVSERRAFWHGRQRENNCSYCGYEVREGDFYMLFVSREQDYRVCHSDHFNRCEDDKQRRDQLRDILHRTVYYRRR